MRTLLAVVISLSIIFSLAIFTAFAGEEFSVKIVDKDGNPISGISVGFFGVTDSVRVTDSKGTAKWTIGDDGIQIGENYMMNISDSSDIYETTQYSVDVSPTSGSPNTYIIHKYGTLSGNVYDPDGKPCPGIEVKVYYRDSSNQEYKYKSAVTGENGNYAFGIDEKSTRLHITNDMYAFVESPDVSWMDEKAVVSFGNTTSRTVNFNFQKDTESPVIEDVVVANVDNWTKEKKLTVNANDNSTENPECDLTYYITKEKYDTPEEMIRANVGQSGIDANIFTVDDNGEYFIYVSDRAGNFADKYTVKIDKIDKSVPTIDEQSIKPYTKRKKQYIKFTASDADSKITVKYDTKKTSDENTPLAEKKSNFYQFQIEENTQYYIFVTDEAGNELVYPYSVGTVVKIETNNDHNTRWSSDYNEATFRIIDDNSVVKHVYCFTEDEVQSKGIDEDFDFKTLIPAEGEKCENECVYESANRYSYKFNKNTTYYIFAVDEVGNCMADETVESTHIDNTNPVITSVDKDPNLLWTNKQVKVDVYANDTQMTGEASGSGVAKVVFSTNKNAVPKSLGTENEAVLSGDKYTFNIPNEDFSGTYYVWAIDFVGNVSGMSSVDVNIEHSAPGITMTPSTTDKNGIYSSDVEIGINVAEPKPDEFFSGIKSISYEVYNGADKTQEGELFDSEMFDDDQWDGTIKIDSSKNNSNDVTVYVYAVDHAGNENTVEKKVSIDITKPTIDVSYDNNSVKNGVYYSSDRTATITVTERNFNAEDVLLSIKNTDGVIPKISEWKTIDGTDNKDDTKHVATISYTHDGDYTFDISCSDMAGNKNDGVNYSANSVTPTSFTIDKTNPKISVSYDNNNVQNGKYFATGRVATVTVIEHNFDENLVKFTMTSSGTVPSVTWNHNGDKHVATIKYVQDADYTFDVTMKDLADNPDQGASYGTSVAAKDFTVDTKISKPLITGVENGKAYKDKVIPVITLDDTNYLSYEVKLTQTRYGSKNKDVTKKFINELSASATGGKIISDTFEKIAENDGIYTLTVKISDKAGNTATETVTFTVNRFGSVYEYNDSLSNLIKDGGAYVKNVSGDLEITEYNSDKLLENSLLITIMRDGKSIGKVKYDVTPVINNMVAVGESGWFQYKYIISKDNFKEDGIYKILISSKDATGNTPENINYKDKEILFRVDKTSPEITSIVGLEKSIVNAEKLVVKYDIFDAIGLKSVTVFVDGKQVEKITDFGTDLNNYSGEFEILETGSYQHIRIVVEDIAGNITDTDSENYKNDLNYNYDILVSTNFFIRWFANKPLFWGTIVLFVIVVGTVLYLIFAKRKKEDSDEQR